jgi:hypothetical protein
MISNAIDFIFSKDYLNSIFVQSNLSLISTKQKTKMSSAEHVWFLLVDSKGAGYMDSGAQKVSTASSADVDDLRDAVYAKNSGILAGIVPAQLKVYRDAAHFSARETEGPLRASTPLKKPKELEVKALGVSEDEALIILVPSPTPSGTVPCFCVKYGLVLPRKQSLPWRWMSQPGLPLILRSTKSIFHFSHLNLLMRESLSEGAMKLSPK